MQTIASAEETLARVDSLMIDDILTSYLRDELRQLLKFLSDNPHLFPAALDRHTKSQSIPPKVTNFNFLRNLISNLKLKCLNLSLHSTDLDPTPFNTLSGPRSALDPVRDLVLHDIIIGREVDVSKIVNLITPCFRLLTVVPIVGMAGLGKTALVNLVCERVMNLFDVKLWVCVSDKCDQLTVLGRMLRSLNASMGGLALSNDKDAIFQQLEIELERKRFLLVLDDVSEDVFRWWDEFRTRLLNICKYNGNVVVVTTRSEKVASVVETSSRYRHTLDLLFDEECWLIVKVRAFRNVTEEGRSYLQAVGREIAKKSRGVPLAANVLGGTLGFIRGKVEWSEIRDSHFLKARDIEESVKSTLELSFDHLPSSLKSCFALCSVLPKGFLIVKEDLIHMWMAESFVDSFDMGDKYFHALLEIYFFQDIESDDDGNVMKCKMHNLVHDFAFSLAKSDKNIHYLYADYHTIRTSEALPKNKVKYLSTIILNSDPIQRSWNPKSLRTLYLNDVDMKILPSSIRKSKRLRYLYISNTKITHFPESIVNMYKLQILTLSNCSCERLPLLGDLPFLNFLRISHMEKVKFIGNKSYKGNTSRHELSLFPALKSLSLSWMENLIEWSPLPHGNKGVIFPLLEKLSIQCCPKLTGFPMRDLTTIVKMEIKDCEELRFIFNENKSFSSLTSLSILGCPKLTYLRNLLLYNDSFKEFRVRRCGWLRFIPDDLGMQTSLVSLHIYCCKELRFFSEEILCNLTQLRKLSIGAFSEKLDDFSYLNRIKDLRRLEELEIWGSDVFGRKMSALPSQLQHLIRLHTLKIKGFIAMDALPEWLAKLQYLETISLHYCLHLEYQSTYAMIQRLPILNHVCLYGCCALEEHKSQWMEFSDLGGTEVINLLRDWLLLEIDLFLSKISLNSCSSLELQKWKSFEIFSNVLVFHVRSCFSFISIS